MSEFEDTDAILRNMDIDEDIEIGNDYLTEDEKIACLSSEEDDFM